MDKFRINVNRVLDFLIENQYSKKSLYSYKKVFDAMDEYLEVNKLSYSPELSEEFLKSGTTLPFGLKGKVLHSAVINKINAVYLTGSVSNIMVSSRKPYSSLCLNDSFKKILVCFIDSIQSSFSESQIENIRRGCSLFLKYLQSNGKESIPSITFEDISNYHFFELSHLKSASRRIDEGIVCHLLRFLFQQKLIHRSLNVYMYALKTDSFISLSSLSKEDQELFHLRYEIHIPSVQYQKMIENFIKEMQKVGYVSAYHRELTRALEYFELFLDFYQIDYSPEVGDIWLNASYTKNVFQRGSWTAARRALFLFKMYVITGNIDFSIIVPRGIYGLSTLPEWMLTPLMNYSESRMREKLDVDTVNNDIYSILRFFRFLSFKKISSFEDISADILLEFNLSDKHLSSEGKNACNARIRRFLRYLYSENILTNQHLPQILGYATVKAEHIISILTETELNDIRNYIENSLTPLQFQDSAVILLGTEMGIRGCDIVRLKITDIDFNNKTISFIQGKTDVEVQLAMPVSVGNAIFRYLKYGRPKECSSSLLFVSLKAPHKPLSRNICYGALKRILPQRKIRGSGFHVTRKTFATKKLQKGISPDRISSAMGQRNVESLTPYLSFDDDKLSMCSLSLVSLDIPWKGEFL